MEAFGLKSFIAIFDVLYKDLKSDIILNGGTIDGYKILRGVKQGDALSCIIFIMCMEPLLRNILRNNEIVGIRSSKLNIDIPKAYGYADDVNAIVKNDPKSIQATFSEYGKFSSSSGLILNADKTEMLRFRKLNNTKRTFKVKYMDKEYSLSTTEGIKINGILFFQDPKIREERNVDKVVNAMTKHLTNWSRRHLTLMGKILIAKAYGISQMVFLMQSIMLNDKSLKRLNQILFKFLWNKNFNAAKAPDPVKREIVLTPCKFGGFGMADINLMNKSLNLRAIGRLTKSDHPMFRQIWREIKSKGFFNVHTSYEVDGKLKEGLRLLNEKRIDILKWPVETVMANVSAKLMFENLRLTNVLTKAGRLSIPVHRILFGRPNLNLGALTRYELDSIARYLIDPRLYNLISNINVQAGIVGLGLNIIHHSEIYPTSGQAVVPISTLSSKFFRENYVESAYDTICVYKSGLILNPGEVLSWTNKVRKLTSTKH